jgi:hypothetical protein
VVLFGLNWPTINIAKKITLRTAGLVGGLFGFGCRLGKFRFPVRSSCFFCLPFGLGWIFFAPHFERTRGQSKHASKAKKTAEQKKDLDLFPCFSMFLSIQIKHAMNWLLYFLSRATS